MELNLIAGPSHLFVPELIKNYHKFALKNIYFAYIVQVVACHLNERKSWTIIPFHSLIKWSIIAWWCRRFRPFEGDARPTGLANGFRFTPCTQSVRWTINKRGQSPPYLLSRSHSLLPISHFTPSLCWTPPSFRDIYRFDLIDNPPEHSLLLFNETFFCERSTHPLTTD